jgi:hypothetical protein
MPFWRIVAALCTLLALTETAIAAAASADVEIHVSDAASREPVRLARVLLVGGKTYAGYTDATGAATFTGVDEGQYRATVSHAGFTRIGSEPFDVSAGRRVLVDVAMARVVGPKVIGRVQTRSIPRLETTTIASGSIQEKLGGGSLAQALGGFSEFGIGGGGFSIDGHDARETEVSIDGVPAGGAGSTGLDLRGLNLDLFSSASSSSTSQNVAGGTVALTTLEPTLAFQTSTTMSYGSDERTNLRFWARGTSGRIGYVYGHAAGGVNGPIDNLTYADASGLDYLHRSGSSARGDLAKIRIPLSVASAFTATFVSSRAAADIVCERFVGPLPCGFGPNNESVSRSSLAIGKLVFNGASSDGLLSVVRATGDSSEDLTRRLVNDTPAPAQTSSHSVSESVFGSLNLRGDLTTTSLVVSAGRARFDQRIIGPFSVAGGGSVSNVNATLRFERQFSERLSAFAALTAMKDGLDKPLGVSSGVSWKPNAADSFSGSVSVRNGGGTLISQGALRDPASLVTIVQAMPCLPRRLGIRRRRAAFPTCEPPGSIAGQDGRCRANSDARFSTTRASRRFSAARPIRGISTLHTSQPSAHSMPLRRVAARPPASRARAASTSSSRSGG